MIIMTITIDELADDLDKPTYMRKYRYYATTCRCFDELRFPCVIGDIYTTTESDGVVKMWGNLYDLHTKKKVDKKGYTIKLERCSIYSLNKMRLSPFFVAIENDFNHLWESKIPFYTNFVRIEEK